MYKFTLISIILFMRETILKRSKFGLMLIFLLVASSSCKKKHNDDIQVNPPPSGGQEKPDSHFKTVATNWGNTMVVDDKDSLWATGRNDDGELGLGNNISQNHFVKVMDNVAALEGGRFFSMVIKTDKSLWVSGFNGQYSFGIKSANQNKFILATDNVEQVSAAVWHALIIKTDKTLWGTGENNFNQLGIAEAGRLEIFTKINLK